MLIKSYNDLQVFVFHFAAARYLPYCELFVDFNNHSQSDLETNDIDELLNSLSTTEEMASHPGLRSSLTQIENLVKKQLSFTDDDSDDSTTPQAHTYVYTACIVSGCADE